MGKYIIMYLNHSWAYNQFHLNGYKAEIPKNI